MFQEVNVLLIFVIGFVLFGLYGHPFYLILPVSKGVGVVEGVVGREQTVSVQGQPSPLLWLL